jgi:hypothetical protein
MGNSGTGAGMRTGTKGKVGFPSSDSKSGLHDRPRLRTYREGVTGGDTSSKSHTGDAAARPMGGRGLQTSGKATTSQGK